MRLVVTGRHGQVARALTEAGSLLGVEVVPIGRPELDLAMPETVPPALAHAEPDIVTNAAAYTAVNQAEREPNEANTINATGAITRAGRPQSYVRCGPKGLGNLAQASAWVGFTPTTASPVGAEECLPISMLPQPHARWVCPSSNSPPIMYSMAVKRRRMSKMIPLHPPPFTVLLRLGGEHIVTAATPNHGILRTAWAYAPWRASLKTCLERLTSDVKPKLRS
jgi:dTDP-4-dehydrorhamnose reductase